MRASCEYGPVKDVVGACRFAKAPSFNPFAADVVAPEAPWKFVVPENPMILSRSGRSWLRREQSRGHGPASWHNQVKCNCRIRPQLFPRIPTVWGGMIDQKLSRGGLQDSLHKLLLRSVIERSSAKGFYGSSHKLQGSRT